MDLSFLSRRLTGRKLSFAAMVAALPMLALTAPADAAMVRTLTHASSLTAAASRTPMQDQERVEITVALKARDRAGLDALIAAQNTPGNPSYGVFLTPEQFTAAYAPTAEQTHSVVEYLRQNGFSKIAVAPNRLTITAEGSVAAIRNGFHTEMVHARDGGVEGIANVGDVKVPEALGKTVLAVLGLQTVHQFHTMLQHAASTDGLRTQTVRGVNPAAFPTVYSATSVATASLTTVAIIAQGSLTQTLKDLTTFETNNGLPQVTTQVIKTGSSSSDTSGLEEWNLDSQDIVGMTGGVAKLVFYDAYSLSNAQLTNAFSRAVSDNTATAINVSLGECETSAYNDGSLDTDDQLLAQADSQGQTFAVSSGDSGADECGNGGVTPSYPASSPYVVAVGGTTLSVSSSNAWSSETAWSGSGGSRSTVESRPSWQTLLSGSTRGVPDVAYDADPNSGALVLVRGSSTQIGGTSLAAPLFTGAWARLQSSKNSRIGFAAPKVYGFPTTVFHDITSGNNGGYSAASGYDLVTGRGSIKVSTANSNL